MAKIIPFCGILFNRDKIRDLRSVMAPPYDCISEEMQEELYSSNPYNVVRLILGKTTPEDTENANRYTRSAQTLNEWLGNGILVQDAEPAIYIYDQGYQDEDGTPITRRGFLALVRLEDFSTGTVKPHERTLDGPKNDRFMLMKACKANLSPIFALYSDPTFALEAILNHHRKREPDIAVRYNNEQHNLWRVTDESPITICRTLLNDKPLLIADGHHRYETALRYRDLMREQMPDYTGRELFNYALMYFCNMEDPGLTVFPIHRLLSRLDAMDEATFLDKVAPLFVVQPDAFDADDPVSCKRVRNTLAEKKHTFAWYPGGKKLYFMTLRDLEVMDKHFQGNVPQQLKTLDISILHKLIFEDLFHISEEDQRNEKYIRYVNNFAEALHAVRKNEAQMAFLLNPTRICEVREVANHGGKMPQKSTYFYPKLLSGLIFNKLA